MNNQTHRKFILMMALLASLSLLLGACSSATPEPTMAVEVPTLPPPVAPDRLEPVSSEDLTGSLWQWAGGREPLGSSPFQVPDPQKYTLTFNEDGSLFVQADCNTSLGTYKLSGDQITITLGATTLVACEVDSLSDHFMANLGQAEQLGTGFGSLVIVLADEAGEMYFQPKAAPDLATNLN
ncbi:MAG: META domain-containing protein, partial [Anaerolineales bacterium]